MNSNKKLSRAAGILYLLVIVGILFDEFYARGNLIVWEDATLTAQNILANEGIFRLGFVINLIAQACLLLLVIVLYQLLKPVNKLYALVMVACVVVTVSIITINSLNQYAAIILLKASDGYMSVFPAEQLNALIRFFLEMQTTSLDINFIYAGLWLLPLGYLVSKSGSGKFSKILGWWLMVTCWAWIIAFVTRFLDPGFYSSYNIFWAIAVIDTSEIVFCFWLLFKGVDIK